MKPTSVSGTRIGGGRRNGLRLAVERAVVATVTVTLAVLVRLSITELGFVVQVASAGAPVQASCTVPLKPRTPTSVS